MNRSENEMQQTRHRLFENTKWLSSFDLEGLLLARIVEVSFVAISGCFDLGEVLSLAPKADTFEETEHLVLLLWPILLE